MKKAKNFFKIEGRLSGDIFWNGVPVEKLGREKIQIAEDVYDRSNDVQSVLIDTTIKSIIKLNDVDRVNFQKFFEKF